MSEEYDNFENWYLGIIGFFYAGQGYALGSMVLLLPLYILNDLNVPTRSEAITIAAMIIFPWYIKFIFGIITDNYPILNRRRKPYLVIATLFSFVGWATIGISETIYPYFFLSGVSLAIGSALGDAVIDGQSIEITPDSYAGRLQGVNWGSRGLGLGAAAYISPLIVNSSGWDVLFIIAGSVAVMITVVTLILPEKRISDNISLHDKTLKAIFRELYQIFLKDRMKSRVLYILFSGFTLAIILQLTLIMETELGYDLRLIGIGALVFATGTFIGSISTGVLTDRKDVFRGFLLLSIIYSLSIMFGVVFVNYRNFFHELIFFGIIGFSGGAYESYQLKVIQEETTQNLESTIFAIYTGISNIGQFAMGSVIIVVIADNVGISILYSMQLIHIFIVLAAVSIYQLKFSK